MVARDQQKGKAALEAAKQRANSQKIQLLLADLALQSDIRRLAREVQQQYSHLDVLINNAAIIPTERQLTTEGIEMQLAVNHLAPFLLTNLLLPQLEQAEQGRVVTVSSVVHARGHINDIQNTAYDQTGAPTKGWQAYCNTKLMNVLFANELAKQIAHTRVTSNSLHPGVIGTNLWRTLPFFMRFVANLTMPKPERGARTSIYLASDPSLDKTTGKYFSDDRNEIPAHANALDPVLQQQLWTISEELVRQK